MMYIVDVTMVGHRPMGKLLGPQLGMLGKAATFVAVHRLNKGCLPKGANRGAVRQWWGVWSDEWVPTCSSEGSMRCSQRLLVVGFVLYVRMVYSNCSQNSNILTSEWGKKKINSKGPRSRTSHSESLRLCSFLTLTFSVAAHCTINIKLFILRDTLRRNMERSMRPPACIGLNRMDARGSQ